MYARVSFRYADCAYPRQRIPISVFTPTLSFGFRNGPPHIPQLLVGTFTYTMMSVLVRIDIEPGIDVLGSGLNGYRQDTL